ncbi:glycine zipper 2TM domain-containing protein [Rhodocyclus tenuis]|uniref:Outer membrane lipoprotein SlyB n=1 Tax=Rhodocyclus tenuis TaxID=1066 RepID=A0A840G541_RHOTE|nr:glycine zipper 2TM domain-containing protein [Rhodocyclus tenuis]MBB4247046.1 outer membrane lipoprotein SlyB [Rhodocyclus tenuis]MBK1679488.1 hypothetical protein [Rhodocyclus tenuis]
MNTPSKAPAVAAAHSTHPLVLGAAIAVIAASLTGIAHFAGWLPSAQPAAAVASAAAENAPLTSAAPASAVTPNLTTQPTAANPASPASAPRHRVSQAQADISTPAHARTQQTARNNAGEVIDATPAAGYPPAPPICLDCGTVESVREIGQEAQGSGLGAVTGGVLGGVIGHQIGNGRGRDVATVVGALGGAFAGNATEKNLRSTRQYQIIVRLEDGSARVLTQNQAPSWQIGDHVRVTNGQISAY